MMIMAIVLVDGRTAALCGRQRRGGGGGGGGGRGWRPPNSFP